MDGNRRMIKNVNDRKEFCKCIFDKVLKDDALKLKYQEKLLKDMASDIFKELEKSPNYYELKLDDCMKAVKMSWTDKIAKSTKERWKRELAGTEFSATNDVEKYCDCLEVEYRKYPLDRIMDEEFLESEVVEKINQACTKLSNK